MVESERRKYPRLDKKIPVVYRLLGKNSSPFIQSLHQEFFNACTVNLSPTGVCVQVERELPEGAIMALTLNFRDIREEVFSIGKVVWCEPAQVGSYLIGVEFVTVRAGYPDREGQERAKALVQQYCEEMIT